MQADLFKNLIHSVLHPTEESMATLVPAACSTEDSRTVEARQEARMGRQLDKAGGAVALPQTWQQHSSRGRLFCHLQELFKNESQKCTQPAPPQLCLL